MRILAINIELPFPPIGGGPLRTFHLLRSLAEKHEVTLVAFSYGDERGQPPFSVRVIPVPWELPEPYLRMESADDKVAQEAYDSLQRIAEPWFVSYLQSGAMLSLLHGLGTEEKFDLVWIEDTDMAQFLPALPAAGPRILDFQNVYSLMARRTADQSATPQAEAEAERTLRFEKTVASQFDLCMACSELEAQAAQNLLGLKKVYVIPNGVDTHFFQPVPAQAGIGDLLFTGTMSYPPNVEAVHFFVASVLPQILRENPSVKFHIVGAKPVEEVKRLAGENVIVHGQVPDVRPYLNSAAVAVVPVRSGGGTRLKVLEAAASGKAIVSTSLGTEGLPFCNGRDALIADTADDFAAAVLSLLKDPQLRSDLGQRARQTSLAYDWSQIGRNFRRLVEAQLT